MASNKAKPTYRGRPIQAIMELKKGETLVGVWASINVAGIGFYKFLAKRKRDGTCAWVHFVQRPDGSKDKFYRGEVTDEKQIEKVLEVLNGALRTAYGPNIKLRPADADVDYIDQLKSKNPADKVH